MPNIQRAFELSPAYFYTVISVLGLFVGSFLNVVAGRVPRGESIVRPPSYCESCGHRLGLLDLIPVLSWCLNRGKCRHCGERYSGRYALWEAATAGLFVLTATVFGPHAELVPGLVMVSILVVAVQTDLDQMIIPDKVVFFGMAAGVILRLFIHSSPLWHYAVAFLAGGGILYAAAYLGEKILGKEAMGGGDMKLLAMLGLYLGIANTFLTLFLGSLIGLGLTLLLMASRRMSREQPIAFGPYLALGALLAYWWGEPLLQWYIGLLH